MVANLTYLTQSPEWSPEVEMVSLYPWFTFHVVNISKQTHKKSWCPPIPDPNPRPMEVAPSKSQGIWERDDSDLEDHVKDPYGPGDNDAIKRLQFYIHSINHSYQPTTTFLSNKCCETWLVAQAADNTFRIRKGWKTLERRPCHQYSYSVNILYGG